MVSAIPLAAASEPLARRKQRRGVQARNQAHGAALPASVSRQTSPATEAVPSETLAPLPKNRALALAKPGVVAQLGNWLRDLFASRRASGGNVALTRPSASQIKALRRQVATMQKTLDELLESSRA